MRAILISENKLNLCAGKLATGDGVRGDDSGDADRDGAELGSEADGDRPWPTGISLTGAQWPVGQDDGGSGVAISARSNLKRTKGKPASACLQCDKTAGTRAKVYFFRLLWLHVLLFLNHLNQSPYCNLDFMRLAIPVSDSIMVDLGVDDLVEDGGDGSLEAQNQGKFNQKRKA